MGEQIKAYRTLVWGFGFATRFVVLGLLSLSACGYVTYGDADPCRRHISKELRGDGGPWGFSEEEVDIDALVKYRSCQASQGDERGQYEHARDLENGVGEPRNMRRALIWYKKAAQRRTGIEFVPSVPVRTGGATIGLPSGPESPGHPEAQYRLGQFYRDGVVVKKSLTQARIWFWRAAQQGHAEAAKELDKLNSSGAAGQG